MGRVGTEGFEKNQRYYDLVANATLAEKTKMDAIINWYEADTWEDALVLARQKCDRTEIDKGLLVENRFKGNFVSENNAMMAIARIANLSQEETSQFMNEFYTKGTFSQNLRDKIAGAFKDEPEKKLIKVLRGVHASWNIDQSNKFQMWNARKGIARNSEHQFDDLLLMQYGEDGATADKLFCDTILTDLGIQIDETKLRNEFLSQQRAFLDNILENYGQEGSKDIHQALITYLQSGEYITYCEKVAGHELTTTATAIKEDNSRAEHPEKWASLDQVRIADLIREDRKVAESMAMLIEAQVRANGIIQDNDKTEQSER